MIVINGKDKDCYSLNNYSGVGLGNFDGLHIGHMALINTLISECKLRGLDSIVYTFTKHPENILRKKLFTPLITNVSKKIELLSDTSLNYVYFDEFDEAYSRMKPEAFVKNVLVDRMKIKVAVAGFDYAFGYRGQGNIELLKRLGELYGFMVIVIHPIKIDDEVVSSTLIRNSIAKGKMEKTFRLLGRHYSITGEVLNGRKIGSKLGFPTANIFAEDNLILPSYGVYISKVLHKGRQYKSITNVGINPTFTALEKVSIETHIFDFNDDIYKEKIEVFFISKLRNERKFKDKDDLIVQIAKDISDAKEFFKVDGI